MVSKAEKAAVELCHGGDGEAGKADDSPEAATAQASRRASTLARRWSGKAAAKG
jgi:hypothetical protein